MKIFAWISGTFHGRLAILFFMTIAAILKSPVVLADLAEAWTAWREGDIHRVSTLLPKARVPREEDDAWLHIRFLVSCVSGQYDEALRFYRSIPSDYPRLAELNEAYVEACRHLGRFGAALDFARARGMAEPMVAALERQAAAPLQSTLDGITVVPFADHPLTPYLPAFNVELNGHSIIAHVDTGGTFLVMGPQRAQAIGIETFPAGKGYHGTNRVDMRLGIAQSLRLGDAVLENVPVATLASLKGSQDFVIFGTNVLQQFYSTLDYPRERLILSPRRDAARTAEHRTMLPDNITRVPFYMWGDHYMFARGGVDKHKNLNFFIDSGLVSLHPGESGGMIQASFTTTRRKFQEWGVSEDMSNAPYFQLGVPLGLGPLEQTGLYVVPGSVGSREFGGIRIDGLLSHAFLKAYAWTIDFDSGEYLFAAE